MRIGFYGAGRVGTVLGRYFVAKGMNVSGYYNRTPQKAAYAANATRSVQFLTVNELLQNSDIIFITVSDDSIHSVVNALGNLPDKIICHTSGAKGSVFGIDTYASASLHPPLAFTSADMDIAVLDDISFVLEGSGRGFDKFRTFLSDHSIKFLQINSADKPAYHAAACMVSNYMATLLHCGQSILQEIGLDESVFDALIVNNLSNILKTSPSQALTGPIMRGDVSTVKLHLEHLPKKALPLYKALGRETTELARLSPEKKEELLNLLK